MAKKTAPGRGQLIITDARDPKGDNGGCGFCLLNLSLMLAAPAALVALVVQARRRSS